MATQNDNGENGIAAWAKRAKDLVQVLNAAGPMTILVLVIAALLGILWYMYRPSEEVKVEIRAHRSEMQSMEAKMMGILKENTLSLRTVERAMQLLLCDKLTAPDLRALCLSPLSSAPPVTP